MNKEKDKELSTKEDEKQTALPGQLNSPDLDEIGKPQSKAVSNERQAFAICKAIKQRATSGRIATAAVVQDKYNGGSPYIASDLAKTGQAWRNNYSTNFLSSIIDRVKPQMLDPIQRADSITYSRLPDEIADSAKKSQKFCEVVTRTIREWTAWGDLISGIAQEDVLNGVATPIRMSEDWRPTLFAFNECFMPEGTGQHASQVQMIPLFQRLMIHDFVTLITKDKDASEAAGYNIENCIAAANAASTTKTDEDAVEKQNSIREQGVVGYSYENSNKTVDLYHLLVREYKGGVDLWTVTMSDGKLIRHVEGLHESMEQAISLFTLQTGSRKFYGSKGLGRMLANLHIAIERGRNLASDQNYLSGLVILRGDQATLDRYSPVVKHPFVMVDKDFEVAAEQINFNAEAFELMDRKLTSIAESIAGAFIPPNIDQQGSPNTKIEAAQRAERELAVRQGVLGRFFDQFASLISMMQAGMFSGDVLEEAQRIYEQRIEKRKSGVRLIASKVWNLVKSIFSDEEKTEEEPTTKTEDKEAVRAAVELLEFGLSVEEIAILAVSPAGNNAANEGAQKDQATLAFIDANKGSPFVDQQEATKLAGELMIGEDRTQRLMTPMKDPNVEAVATRDQLIEFGQMMGGEAMPVSGTDNHEIHMKVIGVKTAPMIQQMQTDPTPEIIGNLHLIIDHLDQHNAAYIQQGPDKQREIAKNIQGLRGLVGKATAELQKRTQQAQQAGVAGAMPAPVGGAPLQATGPGGAIAGTDPKEQEMQEAELGLRAHDQGLRARELDLKEQDMAHKHASNALDMEHRHKKEVLETGMTAMDQLASAAAAAKAQGLEAAKLDLQKAGAAAVASDSPTGQ